MSEYVVNRKAVDALMRGDIGPWNAQQARWHLLKLVRSLDEEGHPAVHTARLMLIQCDDLIEEIEQ